MGRVPVNTGTKKAGVVNQTLLNSDRKRRYKAKHRLMGRTAVNTGTKKASVVNANIFIYKRYIFLPHMLKSLPFT